MFTPFPKLARLNRDIVITEKIDGTNAQVYICTGEEREANGGAAAGPHTAFDALSDTYIYAGSRNRLITPEQDNAGFARWVWTHAEALREGLGFGRHFGEWWGNGIQRGYGLPSGDKRFSLFNTQRWGKTAPPACCSVVPVLYQGPFSQQAILDAAAHLRALGSLAAPFLNPEGIVVFHVAAQQGFKVTLEDDDKPKSQVAA